LTTGMRKRGIKHATQTWLVSILSEELESGCGGGAQEEGIGSPCRLIGTTALLLAPLVVAVADLDLGGVPSFSSLDVGWGGGKEKLQPSSRSPNGPTSQVIVGFFFFRSSARLDLRTTRSRRRWSRHLRRPPRPRPPSAYSPARLLQNHPPPPRRPPQASNPRRPPPMTASSPSASWAARRARASPTGSSTPTCSHREAQRRASTGASGTTATGTRGWSSCTSRRRMRRRGVASSRRCSSCSL
jgi:hypothetical protein